MKSIVTVICVLAMLAMPQLSSALLAQDAAFSAEQILSKAASTQSLTAQECSRLGEMLTDPKQSGLWVQAAKALDSNWASCDTDAIAINLSNVMGTTQTLAGLSFEQMRALRQSLGALRRGDLASGFEMVWVKASAQWKSCAPGELAAIWPNLQGTPVAVAQARGEMVEHAWANYLGKLASLGEPDRVSCLQLVGQCAGEVSDVRKSQLAGDLSKSYLRGGKIVKDIPLSTVNLLVPALAAAGSQEPAEMLAEWMSAADSWKGKVPAAELASLGRVLASYKGASPIVAAGKASLVSHLWANCLGSEAGLAQMPRRDVLALVAGVGPLLAADQKQALSRRLAEQFVGTPERALQAPLSDLLYARGATNGLWTAQELADVYAAWATSNPSWKTSRVTDLVGLAGPILGGKSESTGRLKPLIGAFVWDRYLGPDANSKGVAAWEIFDLVGCTREMLSPQQTEELAARLTKGFAQTPEGASRLGMAQIARAAGAIDGLNKGGMDFMAVWMTSNDCWKTARVEEMSQLFFWLQAGKSEKIAKAKAAMGECLWKRFLDAKSDLHQLTSLDLVRMAYCGSELFSADQRQQLATTLIAALTKPEYAGNLALNDLWSFSALFSVVQQESAIGDVAVAWMAAHPDWPSLKPRDLAMLSRFLQVGKAQTCLQQRRALADQAWKQYLGADHAGGSLPEADWSDLVSAVRVDLSEAQSKQLVGSLPELTPQALSKLNAATVRSHAEFRKAIDPKRAADLVASWIASGDGWKSSTPDDLIALQDYLKPGSSDATAKQQAMLTQHVYDQYCGPRSSGDKITPSQLVSLAQAFSAGFSREQKSALAQTLVGQFSKPPAAAKLTIGDIERFYSVLSSADKGDAVGDIVVAWMDGHPEWASMQIADLGRLTQLLQYGKSDALGQRRKAINAAVSQSVWKEFVDAKADLHKVASADLARMASIGSTVCSAEQKQQMATTLIAALTKPEYAGNLALNDLWSFRALFSVVQQESATGDVAVAWMAAHPDWPSLKPRDLAMLSRFLQVGRAETCLQQRRALADQAWKQYLGADHAGGSLPEADMAELVSAVRPDLSEAQAKQLLGSLLEPTSQALGTLDAPTVRARAEFLKTIDPKRAADLAASWIASGEGWKSSTPEDLSALHDYLLQGASDAVAKQQAVLIQHVYDQYFGPRSSGDKITPSQLASLALTFHVSFSQEQKSALAQTLVRELTKPQAAAKLTVEDFWRCYSPLSSADQGEAVGNIIAAWMDAHPEWTSLNTADLTRLAQFLRYGKSEALEQRRKAMADHVLQHYLGVGADRAESVPGEAVGLALAVNDLLSSQQREELVTSLAGMGDKAAKTSLTEARRIAQTLLALKAERGPELVAEWLSKNETWKTAPVEDVVALSQFLGNSQADPIASQRAAIRKHVWDKYAGNGEYVHNLPLGQLVELSSGLKDVLLPDQRSQLAKIVAGRIGEDSEGVSKLTFNQVSMLSSEAEPEVLCSLILHGDTWRQLGQDSRDKIEAVVRNCVQAQFAPIASEALVRLCLQAGNAPEAERWARKALSDADERLDKGDLDDPGLLTIGRIMDQTGLRETLLTPKWHWSLLLRKAAIQAAAKQSPPWQEWVHSLAEDSPLALTSRSALDLKVLLGTLGKTVAIEGELARLVAATRDGFFTKPRLYRMLEAFGLQEELKTAPPALQGLLNKATALRAEGKTAEAISLYTQALETFPEEKAIGPMIRRELLGSLVDHEVVDRSAIEKQLAELGPKEGSYPADLRDYACRALLKSIASVPPGERKGMWKKEVARLEDDEGWLSEEALADLDTAVGALGSDGAVTGQEMLTDLLVRCCDIPTMHRLQQKRIEALAKAKAWTEAEAAAGLDMGLAMETEDGPWEAARKSLEIYKSAGAPPEVQAALKERLCGKNRAGAGQTASAPATAGDPLDSLLRKTVEAYAQEVGGNLSGRRKAILNMLRGDHEGAIKGLHSALAAAAASAGDTGAALDDIAVALALADRSVQDCERFSMWLTVGQAGQPSSGGGDPLLDVLIRLETQADAKSPSTQPSDQASDKAYGETSLAAKAALAKRILLLREPQWSRWCGRALDSGESSWVESACTAGLNAIWDQKRAENMLNIVYDRLSKEHAQDGPPLLREVAQGVRAPANKRVVLLKLASDLYAKSDYAHCIEAVDSAVKVVDGSGEWKDMTAGFVRAMAMIQLRRFDEVIPYLGEIETWTGPAEEKARAAFLIGWVKLQQDKGQEAAAAFGRLLDKYPQTSFGKKASDLLQRMKGA